MHNFKSEMQENQAHLNVLQAATLSSLWFTMIFVVVWHINDPSFDSNLLCVMQRMCGCQAASYTLCWELTLVITPNTSTICAAVTAYM